jgi:hypothetical protein
MKRRKSNESDKKRKLPSLKSLRNRLDLAFSAWIRKRDADENGMGRCISCFQYRPLQCGHFQKRQHLALRWHPLAAAGQCVRCNYFLGGNEAAFALALVEKYSVHLVQSLMELKHKTVKFSRSELEAMIDRYKGGKYGL